MRSGGEGLDGRPRPVPCASMEEERAHTPSTGRPSRPSLPHIIRPRPYGSPGLLSLFQAQVDASWVTQESPYRRVSLAGYTPCQDQLLNYLLFTASANNRL